jgi:hypothetical protein
MKIVMLTGSPRKKGTSALLADRFMEGAREKPPQPRNPQHGLLNGPKESIPLFPAIWYYRIIMMISGGQYVLFQLR